MRRSPSIVPQSNDRDVYLILDDLGRLGRSWRWINEERTDRETIITDLMDGQYSNPVRIVASTPPSTGPATPRKTSPMKLRAAAQWMVLIFRRS